MHQYLQQLEAHFRPHANAQRAEPMKAYLRNQFECLGISGPQRKDLLRSFLAQYGQLPANQLPALARELFALPEREFHYLALELLEKQLRKLPNTAPQLFIDLVLSNSWWDTVDTLATRLVGAWFKSRPELYESHFQQYLQHPNMWVNRVAIISQLKYRQHTRTDLLHQAITKFATSREFFLQKAIGWALREYSKTDANYVRNYVATQYLAPLSQREALKWLNNQ